MAITGYITMQAGFILLALGVFISWRSVELEAMRYTAYFGLVLFSLIPILLILFSFMPETVKRIISAAIRLLARMKIVKKPDENTEHVIGMLDSYHTSFHVIAKDKLTLVCCIPRRAVRHAVFRPENVRGPGGIPACLCFYDLYLCDDYAGSYAGECRRGRRRILSRLFRDEVRRSVLGHADLEAFLPLLFHYHRSAGLRRERHEQEAHTRRKNR